MFGALRWRRRGRASALLGMALVGILILGFPGLLPLGYAAAAGGARSTTGAASPSPATGFTLSDNGVDPTAVSLTWSQTTDLLFDHYEVDSSSNGSGGPWTILANVTNPNTTEDAAQGLTPSTTYWFRVLDYPSLLSPSSSNVISVTPPSVSSLSDSALSSTSVQLTWTNSATYGGLLSFSSYGVEEAVGTGSFANVATISSASTLSDTLTGLSAGSSYSFRVLTTDGCCGGTLLTTTSNTVTFTASLPLAATAVAAPTTGDVGQPVSFTCSASGGVQPYSYLWSYGDGVQGTGASGTHAYESGGTFNATCRVTDASNLLAEVTVLVRVSPAPSLAISAPHLAAAPNISLNFSASSSGGSGTFLGVSWEFGDGTSSAGSTVSHSFASPGSYAVTARTQDTNGGTAQATVNITVRALSVLIIGSELSGQAGGTFQFSVNCSGGAGGPYTANWDFGDGTTGSGSAVSHVFAVPGSYNVTAFVIDSLGARASAVSPAIHVYEALSVAIQPSSPDPAPGVDVLLTAHVSGGSGNYSCLWNFGSAVTVPGCSVQHAWGQSGRYKVGLTVVDPSAGNSSAELTLQVGSPPTSSPPPAPASGGFRLWVFGLLAIPVIVLLWSLTRRARGVRPRSPAPSPASDALPVEGGAPQCPACGSRVGPWARNCPECEQPLPRR